LSDEPWPQRRVRSRRREDLERDRLFELSLDLLCVCGFDGIFRQVNPAFERVLGYGSGELTTRPFLEFVLADDLAATRNEFARAVEGGLVVTFENRFLHADGSTRWLQWNAAPDPERQVLYATARDITGQKRAAQELARLASMVESSDDAIIGMSLGGVIETWNRAAEAIFGYRLAEVRDKPMSLLIPPGHADHLGEVLAQIRRGQRVSHYETVRLRKDGTVISVSLTVSPVLDAGGAVVAASAIARDVTERRRAERERLDLLQQLEHALARARRLSGEVLVCEVCGRIRGNGGHWVSTAQFLDDYTDARPLTARCPDHQP
jgi:PAS domain S-box-containing protein